MTSAKVVIVVSGGIVQNVIADQAVEVIVLDGDTETSDREPSVFGHKHYLATSVPVELNAERAEAAFSAIS